MPKADAKPKFLSPELSRKLIIEFIGTFFLVFTVAVAGNPVATGAIVIALVYMGGHISGAHFNPAVTLAAYVRKAITLKDGLAYWVTQVIAAAAAGGVFYWMAQDYFIPAGGEEIQFATAFVCELLFTFLLASVVLFTTTSDKTKGNTYYGAAIGLVLMAGGFAVGRISGGVFNPAIVLGPVLDTGRAISSHTEVLKLFIGAPLLGGLLAGLVYRVIEPSKA